LELSFQKEQLNQKERREHKENEALQRPNPLT
jgi:hypothetical protein